MAVGRAFVFRGSKGTVAVPVRGGHPAFSSHHKLYTAVSTGPQAEADWGLGTHSLSCLSSLCADSGEVVSEDEAGLAGGRSRPWRGFWNRSSGGSSSSSTSESPYDAQLAVSS